MSTHSVLRAIANCAAGKRVTVVTARGVTFELPTAPEPVVASAPDPLEVLAQRLLERDVAMFAAAAQASEQSGAAMVSVRDAMAALAVGQEKIVASVDENTRTLHLPVKPVYFPDGKLRHAQRAKK